MSVAATANNFRYIGGGWFYSAYDPSIWERVGLAMGQAAEATLLDYQLGDLFSVCNAGDIRVHFQVMEPTHVSAVGTLAKSGEIEAAVMSNGYHLGLLHEGVLDPEDMFEADFNDHQWYIYMVRALTLLWACMMPGCLFWWFGSHGMPAKPFLAGTACLWTAIWAGTSWYAHGEEGDRSRVCRLPMLTIGCIRSATCGEPAASRERQPSSPRSAMRWRSRST